MTNTIAKFCYESKQHFADPSPNTGDMGKKSINEVLAHNLAHFMEVGAHTQASLGAKSGLGQTTIGLYLTPERRAPSKSGKAPGGTLSHLERIAEALGVEPWKLLRPLSATEREAYDRIEAAFSALQIPKSVVALPPASPSEKGRLRLVVNARVYRISDFRKMGNSVVT